MAVGFPAKTNFATGEVLTATNMNDITGTLNLLQETLYPAGRNKIINGAFAVNQRNFTTDSVGGYNFDRWFMALSGATATATAQTFTLGTAPVAGYEAKNFLRVATSVGNDFCRINQPIESVRTFANQTVILSFWAKGTNPATAGNLRTRLEQQFGSGGSPSASVATAEQTFVLTSNWTRYSFTFVVPSIAGKTIGTNNDDRLNVDIGQLSNASTDPWTIDIWGVQLEAATTGSTASSFQTASGSIGGELALCQRYYFRENFDAQTLYAIFATGSAASTTVANLVQPFPVNMRAKPSTLDFPTVATSFTVVDAAGNAQAPSALTLDANQATSSQGYFTATVASGLTQFRPYVLRGNNTTGAYLGWSADL